MRSVVIFVFLAGSSARAESSVPLQQLLKTSVEQSLTVQSQELDAASQKSLVGASDAWANPQILLDTQRGDDNMGDSINNYRVTLLQPLSLPWGLRLKKKIAQSQLAISQHHAEDQALATQVSMMKAIFEYSAKTQVLKALQEREKRFQVIQKYISTRKYLSPQKSAEALIVANKVAVIQKDIAVAKSHLQHLWNKMNVLLKWSQRESFPEYKVALPVQLRREDLLGKIESQNHDIELASLEYELAERNHKFESWQKWPDISLAASQVKGRAGNPEDNYSLGVNISIPIFNLNRHKTKSAEFRVQSSSKKQQFVKQEVLLSFEEAYEHYKVLREFFSEYSSSKLPKLQKDMDAVTQGFKRGQVDLLTYFEADSSVFERIQQSWTLQSEYVNAVADLSFLTGEILNLEVKP